MAIKPKQIYFLIGSLICISNIVYFVYILQKMVKNRSVLLKATSTKHLSERQVYVGLNHIGLSTLQYMKKAIKNYFYSVFLHLQYEQKRLKCKSLLHFA